MHPGFIYFFTFLTIYSKYFFFLIVIQAIHLIKEMDQDGDERLSEAEILKNQDTFMNSEVTDYGRQLHVPHDEL